MGRPRADAHDTATQERIRIAAEAEFGRAGLEGSRLADIARRAGITRPSLLYHFSSKDDLYADVVVRAFGGLGAALDEAMATEGSFERRLDAAVSRFVEFLGAHPDLGAVVLRELLDGQGPGRSILLDQVAPLLGRVEAFVLGEGAGVIRPGLPVRQAILQVVCSALVRSAATPMRDLLWGAEDHTRTLARHLFLGGHEK